jgi:transcriptional regulator with XRE-family HTH domain
MSNTQTVPTWQLHHRLALALEASGVSPELMAQEIGVHVNSIHNYSHGRRVPKLAVVKLWADVCQVDREWLITGHIDPTDTATDLQGDRVLHPTLFDVQDLLSVENWHYSSQPIAA